jgi:hypothetical protein
MKLKGMILMEHIVCMREFGSVYRMYVGKPEGKRPLGRPRCRWEDNIEAYIRERMWSGFNWLRIGSSVRVL